MILKPAAAVELAVVDADLDFVRIDSVAHAVAALGVDDIHVDPRGLINFAGDADDDLRSRLADLRAVHLDEGQVAVVDQQGPTRLRAERSIGRGRRRRVGQTAAERYRQTQAQQLLHGIKTFRRSHRFRHRQLARTWKAITAAATAALRLSARPAIGIFTRLSHSAS